MRYTTRIIVPPRVRRSGPPGSPGGAYGPQALGVRETFGFGDRLGLGTPAHLAVAAAHPDFAPIFAQQSAREMALTQRSPTEVLGSAARAVSAARFRQPWGADADRLHTAQEVVIAAEAGFTCFTFDPVELLRVGVDDLSPAELQAELDALVAAGDLPDHWAEPYLDRTIDLPGSHQLRVALQPLQRAVLRYAPAVLHCARLASALARSNQGRPFEIEVAMDGADAPATTLEHLFIGLELESRGVRLTGLALRLPDAPEELETVLREHAAVAEFCGPYKLVFDEPSDPASLYPLIREICAGAFHVKTSAASYLEALRVVFRANPGLFRELAEYSVRHSWEESAATAEQARVLTAAIAAGAEGPLFDERTGRRLLAGAFGGVLTTGQTAAGQPFKGALLELLDRHADLYTEAVLLHFEQQLTLLGAG